MENTGHCPRYLIYCWSCNAVEAMENGVVSEDFGSQHEAHSEDVRTIVIKHSVIERAA